MVTTLSNAASMETLKDYEISNLPSMFYYVSDFLSSAECDALLHKIPSQRWIQLSHRRLQAHPSKLTATNTLIDVPLPEWLTNMPPTISRFEQLGVFERTRHGRPNHVLINEYEAGEGIMKHEDGSAYESVVATISLGSTVCLDLYEKDQDDDIPKWRILQEPGSLLVTEGDAYNNLLHGISPIKQDQNLKAGTIANWSLLGNPERFSMGLNVRTKRISLTYRDVTKTKVIGFGLIGRR